MNTQTIIEKMRELPPDKLSEVEDFIDFLWQRTHQTATDRALTVASAKLSETSFQRVWDNPKDAVYDEL